MDAVRPLLLLVLAALGFARAQTNLEPFVGTIADVANTVAGARSVIYIGSHLPAPIRTAILAETSSLQFQRADVVVSHAGLASARSLCAGRAPSASPRLFVWAFTGEIADPILSVSKEGENSVFLKGPRVEGRTSSATKTLLARGEVLVQNLGAQAFGAYRLKAVADASC